MFKVAISPLGFVYPLRPDVTVVEEQRDAQVALFTAAYALVQNGRSVNMAMGADGHWHLRRRARQIRREFGQGVSWRAMPKVEEKAYVRRWKYPWWWI